MSESYRILEPRDLPQWDRFVQDHAQGSIFHSTQMLRVKAATRGHSPLAYGAVRPCGQLAAILVATRVVTSAVGIPMAARSILDAEPIGLPGELGQRGLRCLVQHHDRMMRSQVLFAEVRPQFGFVGGFDPLLAGGYKRKGYLNYEFDLVPDRDELLSRLGPKRRQNVRSTHRKGLVVIESTDAAGTIQLYDLVCQSYARAKLPVADRSLFEAAFRELRRENYRIYIAWYRGEPVAAGSFLAFKERVICWFAGTARIPGVAATTCVFWQAMQDHAQLGYRVFDFAGGGWEGEDYGPGRFKAGFGGRMVNHGRYRKVFAPWALKMATAAYDQMRGLIAPRVREAGNVRVGQRNGRVK